MGKWDGTQFRFLRRASPDALPFVRVDADGGAAMRIQVEITAPHMISVGGGRFRASDLECRVALDHDYDGWAVVQAEVRVVADDGKSRWLTVSKGEAAHQDILDEAYGPSRHILEDEWADYVTDCGWKRGRAA